MKKPLSGFVYLVGNNDSSSPQARTEFLRRKSRAALPSTEENREDEPPTGGSGPLEHLNLFPFEESSEKKGNDEYLKDKKAETVMVLPRLKKLERLH